MIVGPNTMLISTLLKQVLSTMITRQSLDEYLLKIRSQSAHSISLVLQHQQSREQFEGFGYQIHSSLETIQERLQMEIATYHRLKTPGIPVLKKVVATLIHKKPYILILQSVRQQVQTLAQIAQITERRQELDVFDVGRQLTKILAEFDRNDLSHGNISMETVCYCGGKVSLDLPVFGTVRRELQLLEETDKQGIGLTRHQFLKEDVRFFLEMMIKLAVEKDIGKMRVNLLQPKYLNQVQPKQLKQLLEDILSAASNPQIIIDFQLIYSYFQEGKNAMDKVRWRELDILGLPLFCDEPSQIDSAMPQAVIFDKNFELQNYTLRIQLHTSGAVLNLWSKVAGLNPWTILLGKGWLQKFKKIVANKSGRFQVTSSGCLGYYLPADQAHFVQATTLLENSQYNIKRNKFPESSIGIIYSGCSYLCKGLLIDPQTVLTVASCLYDRTNRRPRDNLIFSTATFKSNIASRAYPSQFQLCSQAQVTQYNLGLVRLQKRNTKNRQHLPIVIGLNQQLAADNKPPRLAYSINSTIFQPESINIEDRIIKNLSPSIQLGTPILACVGNRFAVIGMKTAEKEGLIWSGGHQSILYGLMDEVKMVASCIERIQICAASHFSWEQDQWYALRDPSPKQLTDPLSNNNYLAFYDRLEAEVSQTQSPQLRLKNYRLMLSILRTYFNPRYWKVSQILLRIAELEHHLLNYQDAQQALKEAIELEEHQGHFNQYLLSQLYYISGEIWKALKSEQKMTVSYAKSLDYCRNARNSQLFEKCLSNLVEHMKRQEREESISQLYARIKQGTPSRSLPEPFLHIVLQSELSYFISKDKIPEALETFDSLLTRVKSNRSTRTGFREKVDRMWYNYRRKMECCIDQTAAFRFKKLKEKFQGQFSKYSG